MKQNKDHIFHIKDVPKKKMGQIHALALQLITKGIIALTVMDSTKIRTIKLRQEHLVVTIPMAKQGSISLKAFMFDSSWEGLNTF